MNLVSILKLITLKINIKKNKNFQLVQLGISLIGS